MPVVRDAGRGRDPRARGRVWRGLNGLMTDLHEQPPRSSPSSERPGAQPTSGERGELRGLGLLLRPWDVRHEADVEAWLRGMTDPEFLRWNTPMTRIEGLTDARESLRLRARSDEEGASVSFCVADTVDGRALGHIGINEIDRVLPAARVGYWVLPEARGKGVARRALLLAARHAFTAMGLHRMELGHALGHEASCRIAERCGFRAEGTLRGAMFESGRRDRFRDVHLHARLAADPEPAGE